MTAPTDLRAAALPQAGRRPARRPQPRLSKAVGYLFTGPYVLFALAFGIGPAVYAVLLSFSAPDGDFAGVSNYARVLDDFRFIPAVVHVGLYLALWLVSLLVFVVLLTLMVHAISVRWLSGALRLAYYLPGALAGASSVLLWLFMLNPSASPAAWLLRLMGFESFASTIAPDGLPIIFTLIAFWSGAGGWIVVMYGALNNIPHEVMEAARIDGCGPVQMALKIQLPLLRKWIAYMAVLSLAGGTQIFVEPTMLSQASNGQVPNDYSINQLAYLYAFNIRDFNASAAIAVMLLVVALALSAIFVWRGGLFETEDV
ncbi:carbohydrate ABC transporter permease [Quadrisphaera setariae]|uniref:Sugar ABC transporter permease n=1 Tax=Quadrisphaera setariae TaxID=2593304 RepID=A0A5C8Z4D2_9ACTN|nr:sugar ABC transporter permease [Quadrisphaera setariae]TXR52955.1 sugar ABC transporter permease [Quadrisphaera setariae]